MLASILVFSGLFANPTPDEPFTDLAYVAALAQATKQGKLLMVDFTATWCQPCKRMEKDTWGDPAVRTWLAEHAITLQVDVDEQKDLAAQFEVQAMPTVVVMRDGVVFDRVIGYQDAPSLLAWGRGVLAGRRSDDGCWRNPASS